MSRTTIGYYDPCDLRGGTVSYLIDLVKGLDKARYAPVLFAPVPYRWHDEVAEAGATVVTAAGPAGSPTGDAAAVAAAPPTAGRPRRLPPDVAWSAGMARETVRLCRLFRSYPVDLLHVNVTGVSEPAPLAARLAGCPRVVGTYHVTPAYDQNSGRDAACYRLLQDAAMSSLHRVIHICDAARGDWERRCPGRARGTTVIYNGVDVDRLRPPARSRPEARRAFGLDPTAPVVSFTAAFLAAKGHVHLLHALPAVLAAYPALTLLLAGAGPLLEEMRGLAAGLGVSRAVRFLGFVSDVRPVLEVSDVYVQPSLLEVCPISVLEASGFGLPVVVSAVGALPELVADGVSGRVVPPADPRALADALLGVLRQPGHGAVLGASGRERVLERFTNGRMAGDTMAVYGEMMSRLAGGRRGPAGPVLIPGR